MLIQLTIQNKPVGIDHDGLQFIIMEGTKRNYYRSIRAMSAYLVGIGLDDRDDINSLDELKEEIVRIEECIAKSITNKLPDCVLELL